MGRDPDYLAFLRRHLAATTGTPRTGRAAARTPTPGQTPPKDAAGRLEAARRGHAAALATVPRPPVAQVRDLVIDGPGDPLAARLYRPGNAAPVPGMVYLHGGGWALGDVEVYDPVVRALAVASKVAWVSVDYRRPPEDPFPAAVDDAVAAAGWTARNARRLGLDATRLGLAGDSAGGQIAAAAALRLRGTGVAAALQLLVYPALDLRSVPPQPPDPDGLVFPVADLEQVVRMYLDGADPASPEVSPLLAPDLSGMPPAVVATAEYDRLRPQGEAYARRLRAAGVPVTLIAGTGLDHGYLGWGSYARRPAATVARIGATVRAALATSPT